MENKKGVGNGRQPAEVKLLLTVGWQSSRRADVLTRFALIIHTGTATNSPDLKKGYVYWDSINTGKKEFDF
jgi:hypothetical protein